MARRAVFQRFSRPPTRLARPTTVLLARRAQRCGCIVTRTSLSMRPPFAGPEISNTVRAGLAGYSKTVASEVAPVRIGAPKERGALVAGLASERAALLTGVALAYGGGASRAHVWISCRS